MIAQICKFTNNRYRELGIQHSTFGTPNYEEIAYMVKSKIRVDSLTHSSLARVNQSLR